MNAERTKAGLTALKMEASSQAYKLAIIKAADMAKYEYVDDKSPVYGTLEELCEKYNCYGTPAENILKKSVLSADDIHLYFQSDDTSRSRRMSKNIENVGIAVVEQGGMNYVAEIYIFERKSEA